MALVVRKQSNSKISSAYFQTEMSLLNRIAETTQDFNTVAGYLALARYGNGLEQPEPFRHTGAGVNAIKENAHIGEIQARKVETTLRQHGFIELLAKPTRVARYALSHETLDLAVPYAVVVDHWTKTSNTVQSALTRIQKAPITDTQKLDALMVMLNCYRADIFCMTDKGGLDPDKAVYREWISEVAPKANNQEWQANPKTDSTWLNFMRQCLGYRIPAKQIELTQADKDSFWKAWGTLKDLGLVYEVVAIRDKAKRFVCTLRVQDFHADTPTEGQEAKTVMVNKPLDPADRKAQTEAMFHDREWARPQIEQTIPAKPGKQGDPSYMREAGAEVAFYAMAGRFNDSEQDLLRAVMPGQFTASEFELIGIYRPRFRPSTPDVGQWREAETAMIKSLLDCLE